MAHRISGRQVKAPLVRLKHGCSSHQARIRASSHGARVRVEVARVDVDDDGRLRHGGARGSSSPDGPEENEENVKLFVGRLAWATTDASLRAAFEAHGPVVDAFVVKDKETGRSRGFGFVTFSEEKDGRAAIEAMNGATLDGRQIRCNEADQRGRRGPPPGGGGRDNARPPRESSAGPGGPRPPSSDDRRPGPPRERPREPRPFQPGPPPGATDRGGDRRNDRGRTRREKGKERDRDSRDDWSEGRDRKPRKRGRGRDREDQEDWNPRRLDDDDFE
ncbi:MAG: hypothetical protein KC636_01360 [Myxococcales bacterium]|nr:hypothetical protein [Myxococcales bacterium]